MRFVLFAGAVVVLLVVLVILIGSLLPKAHTVVRSATIAAPPDRAFQLISGTQEWRSDLRNWEYFDQNGSHMIRETDKQGNTITYAITQVNPPSSYQRTIADKKLPFGGTWTFNLAPSGSGTSVTIREDGEVYNPVFRFVSRFIMGHTRTLDNYLAMLDQAASTESAKAAGAK